MSAILGIFTYPNIRHNTCSESHYKIQFHLNNKFYFFAYSMLIFGILVASIQVFSYISPYDYFITLFEGKFERTIRDYYLLEYSQGGLPGYLKLFSNAPLSIFLLSSGLIIFSNFKNSPKIIFLRKISLFFLIYKILLSLDRLSIMAVLAVYVFDFFQTRKFTISKIASLGAFLFLAEYISSKRLEGFGILDFIVYYLKMALVNFQLLIDTLSTPHTYGFSTFLSPLTFILKNWGINIDMPMSFDWENNPAQFFTSYLYLDFGFLFFIPFFFLGYFFQYLDTQVLNQKAIIVKSLYFTFLYGTLSFLFVPAIRGPDFYFIILFSLISTSKIFLVRSCYLKK